MRRRHRLIDRAPMALVLSAIVCTTIVFPGSAIRAADAENEVPIETKIVSATVYSHQAQIVRRGTVDLEPGPVHLVCDDLPSKLIETSLSVEGTGIAGARIIGIDLRRTPESGVDSPRLDELTAELQKLKASAAPLEARRRAIQDRKRLADALRNLSAEQTREQIASGAFSPTAWRALLTFHEDEQFDSDERLRALDGDLAEIQKKMDWIGGEIAAMRAGGPSGKELVIDCETATAGTLTVELSYLVPDASWHPEYSVRYIERDGEIELTYWARIGQATGEDWKDVSVVLSTASPQVGAAPPELSPMYLGVTTGTVRGRVTDAATGSPLRYANVSILGTAFGVTTSGDGTYFISNVPAGLYTVQASYLGYHRGQRSRVGVGAGQTERVDLALEAVALGAGELAASDQLVLESESPAAGRTMDREETKVRSITSVTEALAAPPGVVLHEGEVHVRGGRASEVGPYVAPPLIEHLGAELAGSEFAANLVIPKPVELETGGEPRRSMVVRQRIAGEFVLHAVPRLSDHVFVRGAFHNPLEIPILPGTAEVYVETVPEGSASEVSDYVGREVLPAVASGEGFAMHLGVDQNTKVEQKREKEILSKLDSKKRKVEYRYVTSAESFRRSPAALWIVDRIPVSTMKDVKVDDVRIVPIPDERGEDGILTWKLSLEPGQRQEIVTEYVIEHPSGITAGSLGLEE